MILIYIIYFIWFISYIINTNFFHGNIWTHNMTCSQRQWLHSSVGRASHRCREVTGSNLVEVLNFFSGLFTQLHKLRSLRRSFLHFHFISAVHIWFISYIINRNNCFSKIQLFGPKISKQNNFKQDFNPFCRQKSGAFRYYWAITYSLVVAQPIRTQHW